MYMADLNPKIRLFESLPRRIQSAVVGYANAANLSPSAVIEFTLIHFLNLASKTVDDSVSSKVLEDDTSFLSELPAFLRVAIAHYATTHAMPPEFVVELAIAHFLDPDSVTFDDCQVGLVRDRLTLLLSSQQVTAA